MQLKMELDPMDDEMPSPSSAKRARTAPKYVCNLIIVLL
jgi:hypothetical protein